VLCLLQRVFCRRAVIQMTEIMRPSHSLVIANVRLWEIDVVIWKSRR